MEAYKPPVFDGAAFNCPLCGAYATQDWFCPVADPTSEVGGRLDVALCKHCGMYSVWHGERMIYPSAGGAPMANPDLPGDIKADYDEARSIVSLSPRGAAALLRLAIDKLCDHLGAEGRDLNAKIGKLVENGLDAKVQQALDTVRVVGNNAVHPGQIDLRDDEKTALELFRLVNVIVDATITLPKHVRELYEQIVPKSAKDQIGTRDKGKSGAAGP